MNAKDTHHIERGRVRREEVLLEKARYRLPMYISSTISLIPRVEEIANLEGVIMPRGMSPFANR